METNSDREFRLECIKGLGNLQFKLLQCVYDRRSIAERYAKGDIVLHVHGLAGDYRFCATWGRRNDDRVADDCKVPVFVGIGQVTQELSPITSITRLQTLDCCNMLITETLEKTFSPSPENIFRVLNRKLCSIYDITRINPSQLIDEIIQSSTQVIDDLSNKYTKYLGGRFYRKAGRTQNTIDLSTIWEKEGCWIALNDNCITFYLAENIVPSLQICQVIPCPFNPLISAIERLHRLYCPPTFYDYTTSAEVVNEGHAIAKTQLLTRDI